MKKLIPIISLVFFSGCTTMYNPVPEGYTGPTANISDSFNVISSSKVEFFYVDAVDGQSIKDSRSASLIANHGRGFLMSPVLEQRAVPASKPIQMKLVARTEYAAPILALTNPVYQVTGDLNFIPEPGKRYVVRGLLGEESSSVWLEEEVTRNIVGMKIEVKGSAKLGFFEK